MTRLLDGQDAKVRPPKYGSVAWQRLRGDDPQRAAAVITAAEMWRRYGDEDDLLAWIGEAHQQARTPLSSRKTRAELDEAARANPATPVRATAGWPPVAVPGRPGWSRHLVDGRQVDLPHNRSGAAAA